MRCIFCGEEEQAGSVRRVCRSCQQKARTGWFARGYDLVCGMQNDELHQHGNWDRTRDVIASHLTNIRAGLFYPGAGGDIFRPMKEFYDLVDEFVFVDIAPSIAQSLLSDGFPILCHMAGFILRNRETGVDQDIEFTRCRLLFSLMFHQPRFISFTYYHTTWENLIPYLVKKKRKISVLYVVAGSDGEGGTGFSSVLNINQHYLDVNQHELGNVLWDALTNRFVYFDERRRLRYGVKHRRFEFSSEPEVVREDLHDFE